MPHALIVGGTGALGSMIARELRQNGWHVTIASRRELTSDIRVLDVLRPDDLADKLADADIVVSANPGPDTTIERAIVAFGGLCISPATLSAESVANVARVADPKGTFIPHAGLTPGYSNLVVADLLKRLPGSTRVAVGLTFSASGASGLGGRRWVRSLFARARAADSLVYNFPLLGKRRCLFTALHEEGWHPELPPTIEQVLEFCMSEWPVNMLLANLKRLRLLSLVPEAIFTRRRRNPSFVPTRETVLQWARIQISNDFRESALWAIQGDYRTTAIMTAAFCDILLPLKRDGKLSAGVVRLQNLISRFDVDPMLSKAGAHIVSDTGALFASSRGAVR
jgi:hypothetical protein